MPRPRFSILVASLLPLWGGAWGCAGQSSETERQLQRMQERVAILQNERDRMDERLTALEQQQELWVRQRSEASARVEQQRPALKVVRLEPEADGAARDDSPPRDESGAKEGSAQGATALGARSAPVRAPENDGPRVLISGTGDKLTATQVSGGSE